MKLRLKSLVATLALMLVGTAYAGPVIIDGTDANDHGSASGGANLEGWLYMQRALENLAANLAPGTAKRVVSVGTTGGQAGAAIASAFNLSSLAATWTLVTVDGDVAIGNFLSTLSTASTGILYLPTYGLSSGDLTLAEMTAVNANATNINNFVGGAGVPTDGGGLFAMGEDGAGAYGWLTTLIPAIVPVELGSGGIDSAITLTAAGNTAFGGGLSNTDVGNAVPWHGYFEGSLGGLSVLGVADFNNASRSVIIGGGAGAQIGCGLPGQPPCLNVPEPGTLPLIAVAGVALLTAGLRRRRAR